MASALLRNEDLWRECANWLTRCDVLRTDHRANWPSASIKDLANILRDGVLLCNLLNILDPGCIDFRDVNQKPQMAQFLCLRNIRTFLQTCKDIFDLREDDLFEPSMLFDLTNFHRVLCTLSKLSTCPKALKKITPGFSAKKHEQNGSKEDIYQSLQTINTSGSPECSWMKFSIKCPPLDEHDEEVYEDLCYVTFSPQLCETNSSPPVEKRDHVIKELLDTEKNYVDVLQKLLANFKEPLTGIINKEQIDVIFKEIPKLYKIHSEFNKDLRSFQKDGKPELSQIFLKWREQFLIYGSYCANLTDAQNLLQEICDRNEIVNQGVIKCQKEANNGKFKLRDVLSVPMQRILKYHLLLQKLIEETPHNHDEYKVLQRAREAMVDVACYINEVKRDSDQLNLLKQLQENISDLNLPGDNPLQHYGRLIKDGELKVKSHNDQKIHSRYVFIFDKIIILCKTMRPNQFCFKEALLLHEYTIQLGNSRQILQKDTRWGFQWLLVKKNRETVYTLFARTLELREKMIAAFREAFDNIEPNGLKNTNHKFEMHTFETPISCNRCSKFLKGLIYQGYLCKVCNIAVHKDCIAQSGRCNIQPIVLPHPHHNDDLIRDKLWFAGEMERETATQVLEHRVPGTYLLRIRPQKDEARYALSLKTSDTVRHMRIFKKPIENIEQFYLSESRFFKTVVELVEFYEFNSLRENYERLEHNAKLQWPYRQITAIVDFNNEPVDYNSLPIQLGTKIRILKDDGEICKIKYRQQVLLFPRKYLSALEEVTHDAD